MAGLKGSKTEIGGPDGLTVTTTAKTAAGAAAIAARQEQALRESEGGLWDRFNGILDGLMTSAEETNGLFKRRSIGALAWVLALGAVIFAWNSWLRLMPIERLNIVLAVTGTLIVIGMKLAAARVAQSQRDQDTPLTNRLMIVIFGGLILQAVVSTSLYSLVAINQDTGRKDVEDAIKRLNTETTLLLPKLAADPGVTEEQQQLFIEQYMRKPMANSKGAQLYRTFQDMLRDTKCEGSSYYVGIYCPAYFELQATKEAAKTYRIAKTRYDAIPAEIAALEAKRPAQSSISALAVKAGSGEDMAALWPALISLLVDGAMLFFTWWANRPPPLPKPDPQVQP